MTDCRCNRTISKLLDGGCRSGVVCAAALVLAATLASTSESEVIRGGPNHDVLWGYNEADVLRGRGGNDVLSGADGNDKLFGGPGNDWLDGGPGNDAFEAGPGVDRIIAADGTAEDLICGSGLDTVVAGRLDKVATDCERVKRRPDPSPLTSQWYLPYPRPTGITPRTGDYSFNHPVGCFSVRRKAVVFAEDCYRFDLIPIRRGAFRYLHGEIGGTHCPTDGYAISGRFVSESRATGIIKYAFACRVEREVPFIAKHE